MKRKKVVLIVIITILCLGLIFGFIDYNRAKQQKKPIFAIKYTVLFDGGTTEYLGIGYKVIKYNVLDNPLTGEKGRKDVSFGTWFLSYDRYSNN